ncbi:MAG: hypothetical protein V4545_04250 [Pseudomonadota bacterium]
MDPPTTNIHIVGNGSQGTHPIHDRWIITNDSGLRLGSSVNSIGYLRISEISEMSHSSLVSACENFDSLIHQTPLMWGDERLTFNTFTL